MIGDEEFDDFDKDEEEDKGRPWMEAVMEKCLIFMTIASLITFFIMIVF